MIGILGGMGPMATVDFMRKLAVLTPARRDQCHLETITYSCPGTPDRTAAILNSGPSPLPKMRSGVASLINAGARCIAIPCNTAHYWYSDLAEVSTVPVLNIVTATVASIPSQHKKIGLLATSGTIAAALYQNALREKALTPITPDQEQQSLVDAAIAQVKAGEIEGARAFLDQTCLTLKARGASCIIMACTEIPIALADGTDQNVELIDATEILARTCIDFVKNEKEIERV